MNLSVPLIRLVLVRYYRSTGVRVCARLLVAALLRPRNYWRALLLLRAVQLARCLPLIFNFATLDVLYLFPQRGKLVRVVAVVHLSLWRSEGRSLADNLLGYSLLLSGLVQDVGVSEVLQSRAVDR